ncbi:MAG: chorismate mutase, partial [Bacteroidota bacterium]
TRPNSFEGVGAKGLPWLSKMKQLTGKPISTEVASPLHVEYALAHEVDVLWIGARTTVNPFAIQEIAEALKGVDIPVLIKNPVNPDIELWIGAIERFYLAGLRKLAVIHRGFSVPGSKPYRNRPKWEIPIELRRRLPGIEIICDPSHICGNRSLLAPVAQKAMDLNFDGLMIETHIDPDQAWSDAAQQLSPERYGQLIHNLVFRDAHIDDPIVLDKLATLRHQIDQLDQNLFDILRQRMDIVREIGAYKEENNLQILQMERWIEVFQTRHEMGQSAQLHQRFTEGLLNALHKESIRQQTEVMNQSKADDTAIESL